ncbi:tripeptide aminopeptidase [Lentilactobacillus farraginis DSM 18382 = JCM 14108]|uniref:Peptidase T n=1 Tax=Lentilactobacillus farraginis DSM 18382 = JCM 14108 TaxID=1423743 RepID=X0QFN4_9LACO|nr:tripeptide aminopeptidase [Lentilactobacillus farraginis DSM 18382 = JCM 14108]GAF37430.1 tripeptide aminopeptidase [Lentilactobacillus farraginis DSM 18382 = JCM 14108]
MREFDQDLIESLFIKYAKINTRSNPDSPTVPTTPGQVELAQMIVEDLKKIGINKATYDTDSGYALAELPGNSAKQLAPIGFIAHLDTADFNAENISPQVHADYSGEAIILNRKKGLVLSPAQFPNLKNFVGQRLITTDGNTLLGADDKAGITAILGALAYLVNHPEIEHGPVEVAFGPDEEIGRGAKRFPAEKFGAAFAYTMDNGQPGQIEPETFNASQAEIDIKGTAVHPGDAYGLMVNAVGLANEIVSALPKDEVPEKSRGHQGFYLVTDFNATISQAHLNIIIRDFDTARFQQKERLLESVVQQINARFKAPRITLKLTEQYRNIGDAIRQYPYVMNLVLDTYQRLGIQPKITPFRGGTDGNAITAKGIPTPNLFNGGDNFHGPYEYVTTEAMVMTAKVIVAIIEEHVRQFGHKDNRPVIFDNDGREL